MTYSLGAKSQEKLKGVHPDLVKVVSRAITISEVDFTVLEGLRSIERQKQLFAAGKSKTMNSRHITGHAVDLAPYPINGDFDSDGILNIEDWDAYHPIARAMKKAAAELGVSIEWGGDWKSFPDGPHYQLSHKVYPA